nr:S-layer homology domain-containing protein [uncultured Oscillibacter sp.]
MRKNRFLAALLALVMAMSLLPTAAFADETLGDTPPAQEETVVQQEDGTLVPQETGTLVPQETGTLVPQEDGTLVPQETGTLVPQETGTLVPQETETIVPQDNDIVLLADGGSVAKVGNTEYATLQAAAANATAGDTITLIDNISNPIPIDNADHAAITISLPAGVTLDGDGHTISGDVSINVNAAGGTIQNVKFVDIHNSAIPKDDDSSKYGFVNKVGTLTAIYGRGLSGKMTVTNCTFDGFDWEAIQITPVAGAEIVITDNTFTAKNTQPVRNIHVESSSTNVDFSATITRNKFYNGSVLKETALEVYCAKSPDKLKLSGNYIDNPIGVCVITGSSWYNYNPDLAIPFANADFTEEIYPAVKSGSGNYFYYLTIEQAINEGVTSIKLAKNVNENITIPSGKTITLDDGGYTLDGTITNNGTLKIASGGPYELSKISNNGTVTISGGTFTTEPPAAWIADGYMVQPEEDTGNYKVVLMDDTAAQAAGYVARYALATATYRQYYKTLAAGFAETSTLYLLANVKENAERSGDITLHCAGYTFTGSLDSGSKTLKIYDGTAVLDNIICGAFYAGYSGGAADVTVKDGNAAANMAITVNKNSKLTIEGGTYSGKISLKDATSSLTINGGYFTDDPSKYLGAGKTAVSGSYSVNGKTYQYYVTDATVADVEMAVAEGETGVGDTTPDVANNENGVTAETLKEDAAKIKATNGLIEQATEKLSTLTAETTKEQAVEELGDKYNDETNTITIVAEPYLAVEVKSYEETTVDETTTNKALTVGITAMYNIKATTGDPTKSEGEDGAMTEDNTVLLETKEMSVSDPVTLSIPLPAGFVSDASDQVYVQHKGYEYDTTISGDATNGFTATFTNPHGFSDFVLTTTSTAVAQIGETKYTSLQSAVDAVEDDGTIDVLTAEQSAQVNAPKSFTLIGDGANTASITAASGYDLVKSGDNTYTVTAKQPVTPVTPVTPSNPGSSGSSGGSSGSASSGYPVSVSSTKNGTVTASPRSANKGATVTLTVKPGSGYELDSLTVTDKNGDTVKLTRKSDTKYTFTMPASKVTVEAAFAKTEETPERRFTDVPGGYWAETEINWAAENGYINGNTATTYNPEAPVTRQQLWTILARLSGQRPADFVEARAWAVENGVSDGTNPGVSVSRQQLVTILHRWARKMGYSVSGAADLTAYPDHASVASYAEVPMSWSVANGIVGGTAQGTLNPAGATTRAQFAVILYRFWANIA